MKYTRTQQLYIKPLHPPNTHCMHVQATSEKLRSLSLASKTYKRCKGYTFYNITTAEKQWWDINNRGPPRSRINPEFPIAGQVSESPMLFHVQRDYYVSG